MKRLITYSGIILLLLTGCVDKSYKGVLSEMLADEELPVQIIIGDPGDILESKGSGALEDSDPTVWEGKTIHIYAFKRDINSDYSVTSATGKEDCLIDASCDTDGCIAGKEASVNAADQYVTWNGANKVLYYKPGNHPYDFFAYYTDVPVADEDIYRSREDVRIVIDIDGSSDIMSAHAQLTEQQLSRPGFSEMDRLDLTSYSFSAWSAKRNIHPVMYFKHHLTRFNFQVRAGWDLADEIIIDSLVIASKKKAVFTVANKNPNLLGLDFSSAPYDRIPLSEADGSMIQKDSYKLHYVEGSEEMTPVGGSLMVAPDTRYDAYLYLKQKMPDGEIKTHENHINLTCTEGRFDAGSHYLVSAVIYGLTSVDITVTLDQWKDGGSVNIGSDRFEDE